MLEFGTSPTIDNMAPPNLIQLAEHISTQAAAVASILQANNTDANSVQTHGYPTGPGFENLQAARQELLKAASDLEHLVLGHAEWLKVTFIAVSPLAPCRGISVLCKT